MAEQNMVELLVPIFGIVFTFGIPGVVLVVWLTLNYRKRQRLMELHHTERMAAIERGMDIPPLPIELIDGRSTPKRRRSAMLPGLVWFFVGLGLVASVLRGDADGDMPLFVGLIPLGIGLAYLIYYFVEGRKVDARWLEHDLAERASSRPANPL